MALWNAFDYQSEDGKLKWSKIDEELRGLDDAKKYLLVVAEEA